MNESRRAHWQSVYHAGDTGGVSWYQAIPTPSLELIAATGLKHQARVVDVGGGHSTLVDHLVGSGWDQITVVDISGSALTAARRRLGRRARRVEWVERDLLTWRPRLPYALWHDRALLHFLIDEDERERYREVMNASLEPGGFVLIGTFAEDGPERCSGLPVRRYSPRTLATWLGPEFEPLQTRLDPHRTPNGKIQHFQFSLFRHQPTRSRHP
ncbi:MAG: class I SAM-dependent methyltransferase [Rhodocyclaceae bacterium]|nr:class I SAM-dependent methyltransferase [Gammaproteobacteria bacterium]MCB1886350.1 class I SAM-dependent methyltransferase [Rhodocyclaceae bacterium]MCP5135355.1 class I SAM-dependent methyltransferase [Gammaproteobacteria bacterium]